MKVLSTKNLSAYLKKPVSILLFGQAPKKTLWEEKLYANILSYIIPLLNIYCSFSLGRPSFWNDRCG